MYHTVKYGETLFSIAEDYRVSMQALVQANNITNPNYIVAGQMLLIPGLPPKESIPYSIHVSLNKMQLQLLKDGELIKTYPVAIGRMVTQTPVGDFVIVNRAPNPGGPYGTMWLSLSKKGYGIHGTNDPSSIGKMVSLGCIRMHNRDVEELAALVPNGTPVQIRP